MANGRLTTAMAICGIVLLGTGSYAAQAPVNASAPSTTTADQEPEVPPAKPGVFVMQKKGANHYHMAVRGHTFTTRDAIEKYLLYRASDLTLSLHDSWFTLVEAREKGDIVPPSKPDPAGPRYSFRMAYWRPIWHFKLAGSSAWKSWSPFSGTTFPITDPKTVSDFEVSADVVLHKGLMNDADPLAYDASAVSDLLVNQVSPPE